MAVALSGNGDETRASVRLYAAPSGGKSSGYDYDMLTGAHSVLWDDVRQLLWVLGSSELRAYRVSGTVRDPKLTRITSAGASGKWGGHDLSAIHGEPDLLLISGAGAFVYSKTSGTVSDALPKSWGVSVSSTKCLCSAVYGVPAATGASRLLLLTQATKVFKDHDTDRFSWFIMPDGDLTSAAMKSGTFSTKYMIPASHPTVFCSIDAIPETPPGTILCGRINTFMESEYTMAPTTKYAISTIPVFLLSILSSLFISTFLFGMK